MRTHVGSLVVQEGTKFAVVVARFNDLVTKLLLEGAVEALKRHGAEEDDIEVQHDQFWIKTHQCYLVPTRNHVQPQAATHIHPMLSTGCVGAREF